MPTVSVVFLLKTSVSVSSAVAHVPLFALWLQSNLNEAQTQIN